MNRCRRCGVVIGIIKNSDLWCSHCRRMVDDEIAGVINLGFDFYFAYYQRNEKPIRRKKRG